jgi:carbamoyltransferase
MPVHVLGFNATHDAAAVLLRDGVPVMAVEEERLSRVKHHFGMPERAVGACLAAGGIGIDGVDHVAFYMDAGLWLRFFGTWFLRGLPSSLAYTKRKPALWRSFLGVERRFRRTFGYRGPFHMVEHHEAHAASAFWPSGFPEAAVLTVDGAGEKVTTLMGEMRPGGLVRHRQEVYPRSVGKVWEAVTDWLGFLPQSGEGKVMGLAAWGRPALRERFREVFRPDGEGSFHVDLSYFDYPRGRNPLYGERFVRAFGPPRGRDDPVEPRHEDVAFALQAATEEVVLHMALRLRERTGLRRIVMAGGCALNAPANYRVATEAGFDEVFIQPAAGDNGACLGAALTVYHRTILDGPRWTMRDAFLGPSVDDDAAEAAVRALGLPFARPADVESEAARLLAEGKVIGWARGRMEYGPRALGHRSILADPRSRAMFERVNLRVKQREPFRPLAPVVRLEDLPLFVGRPVPSPYMLLTFPVLPGMRERIPAVVHADGTARMQTVTAGQEPSLHRLLGLFGDRSGVPCLMNTSFNRRGEPVVATARDAAEAFRDMDLDALVLGNLLVTRPDGKR